MAMMETMEDVMCDVVDDRLAIPAPNPRGLQVYFDTLSANRVQNENTGDALFRLLSDFSKVGSYYCLNFDKITSCQISI